VPRPELAPLEAVLLVSDQSTALDVLAPQLRGEGYQVEVAGSCDEALAHVADAAPRLILLDVSVEGPSARDVLRRLRAETSVPIIVFSSVATVEDVASYLDVGADDYLPRPDRARELVARMRALFRRVPHPGAPSGDAALRVGEVTLDTERHEVTVRGRRVELPFKQFQLLELFLTHPGQVLTRATILRRVWGDDSSASSNILEVQIKRLRASLEANPLRPTLIRTVRGLGYLYAGEPRA